MSMHPSVPMRPEDRPQQTLYQVKNLPPKPPGFDCECTLSARVPDGVAPREAPSSAEFVAMAEWAWDPGHNRIDAYYLSTNRSGTHWLLWLEPLYQRYEPDQKNLVYAYGPRKGVPAKVAAVHLLLCAWRSESGDYLDRYHWIDGTGLLSVGDLEAIADIVWDEDRCWEAVRQWVEDHDDEGDEDEADEPSESEEP